MRAPSGARDRGHSRADATQAGHGRRTPSFGVHCGLTRARAARRCLVAATLVLLAGPAVADDVWRSDVPCGRLLGAPEPGVRDGCADARCVAAAEATEVCSCGPRPEDRDGAPRISVRAAGAERQGWAIEPMLGDGGAFRVALADLDGDWRDELLVGTLETVSNGMAVQSWSLCVVAAGVPPRAPSCVAVDDFPFLGMATRGRGERGCRVLATRWLWGSEPARGDGLYLVGRFLAYRDGALASDAARSPIARRYLYRFAAERADAIEHARSAPIAWWRDQTTRALRCPDPLCDERKVEP